MRRKENASTRQQRWVDGASRGPKGPLSGRVLMNMTDYLS
jgi:hypothetical protein